MPEAGYDATVSFEEEEDMNYYRDRGDKQYLSVNRCTSTTTRSSGSYPQGTPIRSQASYFSGNRSLQDVRFVADSFSDSPPHDNWQGAAVQRGLESTFVPPFGHTNNPMDYSTHPVPWNKQSDEPKKKRTVLQKLRKTSSQTVIDKEM
jgi:hypothetical protein